MACSRPLVASAVGGLAEVVVPGETGLLVPPEDPRALAGALAAVLRDAGMARTMGAAGRKRFLERFTNERMVDGWLDCYARLGRTHLVAPAPVVPAAQG
jgi:glycosyltransferase involved in cell wall biosynthesis